MLRTILLLLIMGLNGMSVAGECEDDSPCVFTQENEQGISISGRNTKSFDITVGLELELDNMTALVDNKVPKSTIFVLRANSERKLVKLVISDKHEKSRFSYSYTWLPGDLFAEHDNSFHYRLPYAKGKAFYVTQTCNGGSHSSSGNLYAVDFAMPVGTPIHAARAGEVVKLHEVSISGGTSTMNYDEGNFVQLRHSDGTMASYHHLRTMGVKVDIGDKVKQGEFIGYSGNTGFTSGPHLHFVVQKPDSAISTTSFPVKWKTARGVLSCPRIGLALKSN